MAHHVWGTKRAATSLHICGILHVKKKNWIIAPIYSLGWISSITLLSSLQTTCRRESSPQHSYTRGLFNRSIENIYQAFPHNKSWGPDSPRVILGCRKHQQGVQLGSQVLHAFFSFKSLCWHGTDTSAKTKQGWNRRCLKTKNDRWVSQLKSASVFDVYFVLVA